MLVIHILALSAMSGIAGRFGGCKKTPEKWYSFLQNTRTRDIGCSLIASASVGVIFGWYWSFWWVYVLVFAAHWACFSTYFQYLFNGEDNLWFSGAMVGLAISPIMFMDLSLWWFVLARAFILCVIWGSLNKFLPNFKGRDVVEESARYAASL